ncbi:basic amino acid/polyamine antiporter [Xanthobacter sp. KR7-65]|uniref:basic amino acid/polyamine antiporter n=1 Tax=Xanthobacter sp. KR7-65 TaxID=3156612 RepID=UPI0032B3AC53
MSQTSLAPAGARDAGEAPARAGLSLAALSGLVVGSMVGGGVYSLPEAFGEATGVLGALIAWAIAGTGMLMLALVFQTLSRRRPDIDAGIYGYAQAGFGAYVGFIAALSYWASAFLGIVALLVLAMSTLGTFLPAFGNGNTPLALVVASALLWSYHLMLLRGVKEAASLNTIVTVAKLVPLAVFLVIVLASARADVFTANLLGGEGPAAPSLVEQVQRTMLVVVFVFIGIEGASVYSRLARRREDVGRATVIGFLGVLTLFVLVTVLSYAILPRAELAALHNPSVAGVLAAIVGPPGRLFVSIGVLVSILGALLAWSLLAAEVLFAAARRGSMPHFLAAQNSDGAPSAALWLTTLSIQLFLLMTLASSSAFRFFVELTSSTALIPYFFVAAFGLKLAWSGATYAGAATERRRDVAVSALATLCAAGMIYAGGIKVPLLSSLILAPGTILFILLRREQGAEIFTPVEWALAGAVVLAAGMAVWAIATGAIAV